MNQQDALTKLHSLVGAKARVEQDHSLGFAHGNMDDFYLWDGADLLASSSVCWEQAFAVLEAKQAAEFAEDDSNFEPTSEFDTEEAQIGGAA